MTNNISKPIQISMQIELQTSDNNKKPLEQLGYALSGIVNQTVNDLAWQWGEAMITQWTENNPGNRLVHKSFRKVFTLFGEIKIPWAEIRKGKQYIGNTSQLVFFLNPKQKVLESAKTMISNVVTVLSFRKSQNLLMPFCKISHQRLHLIWRSIDNSLPNILSITKFLKRFYQNNAIIAWLDGWVIHTREKFKAPVIKNTLRIAVARFTFKNQKIWKATFGFLEESYSNLFANIVPARLREQTNVMCDGESAIEESFTDERLIDQVKETIDPITGEIISKNNPDKNKHLIDGMQRCLFHFTHNIIQKARSYGFSKEDAQALSNNLKAITYFRLSTLRLIKDCWEKVVMERISLLHFISDQLEEKSFKSLAANIRRAIPYLFTYVYKYLEDGIFIGRTSNKLERMFRHATYRLKRIGAIWSPQGAKQMIKFIFAQQFNYKFQTPVNPLFYQISACVVKV